MKPQRSQNNDSKVRIMREKRSAGNYVPFWMFRNWNYCTYSFRKRDFVLSILR